MSWKGRVARSGHSLVSFAWRIGFAAVAVLAFRLAFFPIYQRVSTAAFLFSVVPCVVSGVLLGVWGALGTVVLVSGIEQQVSATIGVTDEVSLTSMYVTGVIKILLGVGAAVIMQYARRLRFANQKMAEEANLRLKSEALLERSERKYRVLVESMGEGVGVYDAADSCVFANPALATSLGRDGRLIVGGDFISHWDEASRARIAERRRGNSHESCCYEVVPKNNPDSVFLVTETPLAGGALDTACDRISMQTLRVVRDLSYRIENERKQRDLERQLQRGQALQSLAVLAGGVAHDFNNLLSGIVGNVEFALRRIPRAAPLELTQCMEEIRGFAAEATQLSRQMLAYAGRRSFAVGAVDVNIEVREALKLLHSTIESQALLRLELSQTLPQVKADRIQLRQVVTNLVLNALEAMNGERGTVTIRTQAENFNSETLLGMGAPEGLAAARYVTISVVDTGVGIPSEIRDRIFDPFFSTKSPGRGMGLAASVGIVRTHRGWLDVTSEPGKGSTFRILLPLAEETQQIVRRMTPVDLHPSRAGSVLLIDDEVAVRVVTNRLLTDLGQRVMTADSGRRGVELYREHHSTIDWVLLDLTMPELSGPEVLDELRSIRNDVSVVVTSGFHPSNAADLLTLPNVVGFLEKPHNSANLEAIVATMSAN